MTGRDLPDQALKTQAGLTSCYFRQDRCSTPPRVVAGLQDVMRLEVSPEVSFSKRETGPHIPLSELSAVSAASSFGNWL